MRCERSHFAFKGSHIILIWCETAAYNTHTHTQATRIILGIYCMYCMLYDCIAVCHSLRVWKWSCGGDAYGQYNERCCETYNFIKFYIKRPRVRYCRRRRLYYVHGKRFTMGGHSHQFPNATRSRVRNMYTVYYIPFINYFIWQWLVCYKFMYIYTNRSARDRFHAPKCLHIHAGHR